MTQPDGGQSPYEPPQQPPEQGPGQPAPQPGAAPVEPTPYQQDPYQQQGAQQQGPYQQQPTPYQQTPYPQAPQQPVYAQGGQPYQQGGQPYAYGGAPLPKNNLGVWSLVLGILSVLGCGLLTGIAAIITGMKSRTAAAQGEADNGGMGLAGLITGWVGTVLVTLSWVGVFIYLAFIGAMVNSPEFQDDFDQEFDQQFEQEFDQGQIDPELEELQQQLDELENS